MVVGKIGHGVKPRLHLRLAPEVLAGARELAGLQWRHTFFRTGARDRGWFRQRLEPGIRVQAWVGVSVRAQIDPGPITTLGDNT